MERTVLDRRFTIAVEDRRGETALRCIGHVASRVVYRPRSSIGQQKTRPARRRTGFVCPARYLQAEANLALAAFIERPQAEASNRRNDHYTRAHSAQQRRLGRSRDIARAMSSKR